MPVTGNIPSSGIGIETSAITTTFSELFKPQYRNALYRIHGDQGQSYFNIVATFGYDRPVRATANKTFEEDWIQNLIYIGAGGLTQTAGAPNPTYTFLLSTATPTYNFIPSSTVAPYSTAYYLPDVQIGDVIMFPPSANTTSTRVVGTVTNVAGTYPNVTVTVALNETTQLLAAADYIAGTGLTNFSRVNSEGGTIPDGYVNKPLIDTHYTQIIDQGFRFTGTQEILQPWITEYDGQAVTSWVFVGRKNTDYLLQKNVSGAMMFERPLTTAITQIDPGTNEPYYHTEGLIPYIERRGNIQGYTPGFLTPGIFDQISKIAMRESAPRSLLWWTGFSVYQEIENMLKDYFAFTQTNYEANNREMAADFFGGASDGIDRAMSLGFKSIKKSGYTHFFNIMDGWSNPRSFGATGYNIDKLAAITPLGTKKSEGKDTERTGNIPYFGMMYMSNGDYSRKMEVWDLSGAGNRVKVLDRDMTKLCMRAHVGAEHCGGNQMILLQPTS